MLLALSEHLAVKGEGSLYAADVLRPPASSRITHVGRTPALLSPPSAIPARPLGHQEAPSLLCLSETL